MARWMLVLLVALPLAGCGDSPEVKECIANGVQYFKDYKMYPRLPATGGADDYRRADEVAAERCRITPTAFPQPR